MLTIDPSPTQTGTVTLRLAPWALTGLRVAGLSLLAAGLFAGSAVAVSTFWLERLRTDVLREETKLDGLKRDTAEAEQKMARLKEAGATLIDCTDATGRPRKCIRIDPAAGEMQDAATKAVYRAIHGL